MNQQNHTQLCNITSNCNTSN